MDEDGKEHRLEKHRKVIVNGKEHKLTKEEREEILREVREGLDEMDVELREAMAEHRAMVLEMRENGEGLTRIDMNCKRDGSPGEVTTSDGQRVVKLCTSQIVASALTGLKQARNAIATNSEMPEDMRAEMLEALDEKIENWKDEG